MARYRKGQDTPPRGRKNAERWYACRKEAHIARILKICGKAIHRPAIVGAVERYALVSMSESVAGMTLRIVPHDCCLPAPLLCDDEPNPKET